MSESSDAAFNIGFSIVNPVFGAFAAVANFLGNKPTQAKADRGRLYTALPDFIRDTGLLIPRPGKARTSPLTRLERGLPTIRERDAYTTAIAAAAELGWTLDPTRLLAELPRSTFADNPVVAAELWALAVGRAALQGFELTTAEVFPRIPTSRTSSDWLALGAGVLPLVLDALPPLPARGKLDIATATASTRIPEIFVFAPPPVIPAVTKILTRAVPGLARVGRARRPIRDPEPLPITGPPGPGRPPAIIETVPELPEPLAQPEPALQPARVPFAPTFIPEIIVTTARPVTRVAELLSPGLQSLLRLQLGRVRAPRLARQSGQLRRGARVRRGTARTLIDLADVTGPALSPAMQRLTELVTNRAPVRTLDQVGQQLAQRARVERKRDECECECEAEQETERDACYSGFFKEQRRGQSKRNWTAIDCDTGRTIKTDDPTNLRNFL